MEWLCEQMPSNVKKSPRTKELLFLELSVLEERLQFTIYYTCAFTPAFVSSPGNDRDEQFRAPPWWGSAFGGQGPSGMLQQRAADTEEGSEGPGASGTQK